MRTAANIQNRLVIIGTSKIFSTKLCTITPHRPARIPADSSLDTEVDASLTVRSPLITTDYIRARNAASPASPASTAVFSI